jgi:hypothetical protein
MKLKFGIRMDGNEQNIQSLLTNYITNSPGEFSYLEIGAAGCVSLNAVKTIVSSAINHLNWQVVGLDLQNGWSLDWSTISSFEGLKVNTSNLTDDNFQLVLSEDPRAFVRGHYLPQSIDICFIDGCHGKNCVIADFENIEPYIKPGGIVFFHDAGEIEQGTDWQGHCQEFINVRSAIAALNLLPLEGRTFRPGWRFIGESAGTRMCGGEGNNCIFVQKLKPTK